MSDDRVLEMERFIKATPDRVFEAWTNPELLLQWWGPEGFDTPFHSLDVRTDGAWETTMRSPEGKLHHISGVYRVIERPIRLEFTWAWRQEDGSRGHETLVSVSLQARDGGTAMRLVQKTFQDKSARDSHEHGWGSSFVCLERVFEKKAAA
jgi:uncharacterized protein YndB with AHSA1/START domain